jgi:hypothetical protein
MHTSRLAKSSNRCHPPFNLSYRLTNLSFRLANLSYGLTLRGEPLSPQRNVLSSE